MSPQAHTTLALGLILAACGSNSGQLLIDADPNAPDADITLPDADIAQPDADPNAPDAGPSLLRFTNVSCSTDFSNGDTLVEGKYFECGFVVEGTTGRAVTLSCEDLNGDPIVCDQNANPDIQLQPFGANLPPVDGFFFGLDTAGLGGTTLSRVWVAEDGVERATHNFSGDFVVDDGVNEPPTITFTCNGVAGNVHQVAWGTTVNCQILFADPDPDDLAWSYAEPSLQAVINTPSPVSGFGRADVTVDWTWVIEANEPGVAKSFNFTVSDGTTTVNRTLSFRRQ